MANPDHVAKLKEGAEAWNEWRHAHPTILPDLTDANLCGVDLSEANLNSANLDRANLTDAVLNLANLTGARAVGATLRARLIGTNFFNANLRGANVTNTNLITANLSGAKVGGAMFARTSTYMTRWCDLDLSEAVGLESIRHSGPSTIGLDTLAKSKGRIPDVFLRGCGLADWEIENSRLYATDLSEDEITTIQYRVHNLRVASPIRFYSVFISYSHEDKAFARALHDALQAKGIRCWLDEKQLLPGDDIHERIDHGIRHWDKVILCASKASLTSWWVDKELTTAFAKEARLMKERGKKALALVPLNLDGFMFKWDNGKAEEVKARFVPDFTAWQSEDFDLPKCIEPLIKALRADDGGREPAPTPRL